MQNKEIRRKLNELREATKNEKKIMETQVADGKEPNKNFKDLEQLVYSTIK